MKKTLITVLRDRETTREKFRQAADQLASILAVESAAMLPIRRHSVQTPLDRAEGECFEQEVMLVPILRSGMALLPSFMRFHPSAAIGFIGARRDETTAKPHLYYKNLPVIREKQPVFVLDPMVATAGSAMLALQLLKDAGAAEEQITLISFIGSREGITRFQQECPAARLVVAQVDEILSPNKWIVPGLGDFGDRYFGTEVECIN